MKPKLMHSNSRDFKQILAYVRKDDFAHPGEAEAIDLVFGNLSGEKKLQVLDVGCGLGGTANYVTQNNWGKVTGIDIDPETIEYAKQHYPNIDFYVTDVVDVSSKLPLPSSHFDIIYLFNSFYAFPDQKKALAELRKVAKKDGILAIFDYALEKSQRDQIITSNLEQVVPNPIQLQNIKQQLHQAGWQLNSINYLHDYYLRWYEEFVQKIRNKEQELKQKFGEETFALLVEIYTNILDEIRNNSLTGVTIYARAI